MSAEGDESLAQRVANTRARQAGDAATRSITAHSTAGFHPPQPAQPPQPLAPVPPQAPTVKHCWYLGPYGRQAALLVRWRHVGDGYDGQILVPAPDEGGWAIVEMWVESNMLAPA
ncbi:hypothetical protein CFI00_01125 [Nocardioides sp. S5]|nr:hypothetical protein CFI00_01125 [Nocardioides sp. S5]